MTGSGINTSDGIDPHDDYEHKISSIMHQVLSTTIAILGTVINTIAIYVLIKSGLYHRGTYKFILNLLCSHLLMCSVCLPLISMCSFSHDILNDTSCRFIGFVTYSVIGADVLAVLLIAYNRYFLIVKLNLYHKIYTPRNIVIMISTSWTFYTVIFIFPLTEVWGTFAYDDHRFICHPFQTSQSFRHFAIGITLILGMPSLSFCYVEIIRKIVQNSRRVQNSCVGVEKRRSYNKQVVWTVMLILTCFVFMYLPFSILTIADPQMIKAHIAVHVALIYLGWSHTLINAIIYSVLNQHVKKVYLNLCQFCTRHKTKQEPGIPNIEVVVQVEQMSLQYSHV